MIISDSVKVLNMCSVMCFIGLFLKLGARIHILEVDIGLDLGFKGFEAFSVCHVVDCYAAVRISEI